MPSHNQPTTYTQCKKNQQGNKSAMLLSETTYVYKTRAARGDNNTRTTTGWAVVVTKLRPQSSAVLCLVSLTIRRGVKSRCPTLSIRLSRVTASPSQAQPRYGIHGTRPLQLRRTSRPNVFGLQLLPLAVIFAGELTALPANLAGIKGETTGRVGKGMVEIGAEEQRG